MIALKQASDLLVIEQLSKVPKTSRATHGGRIPRYGVERRLRAGSIGTGRRKQAGGELKITRRREWLQATEAKSGASSSRKRESKEAKGIRQRELTL